MIDRLEIPGNHAPARVDKPRQSGRGFADWLEREPRAVRDGDAAPQDASASSNARDASSASDATEMAQIAEQGAGFPAVELELRRAAGELETISLPWKLAANGGLSHRLLDQANLGLAGLDPVAGMNHAMPRQAATVPTGSWLPPIRELQPLHGSGGYLPLPAAAVDVESGDASSPAATRTWAAMPWLVRLFRWLEQKGHDPSIWLRDYRLDQADAHQLAEALRAHASEQGVRLERIVVNGRELWRAPDTSRKESSDAR